MENHEQSKYSRQGKASKQKRIDAFNQRKNIEFDQKIAEDLAAKYGLNDFPTVSNIPVQSSKPAEEVPIVIRSVPPIVDKLWLKMRTLGVRNFQQFDSPAHKLNLIKVISLMAEAKVQYAQRNGSPSMPLSRSTSYCTFTDDQLVRITNLAKTLPKPIAGFLDNIGYFTDQGQTVIPTKARLESLPLASGVYNYFPSDLKQLYTLLRAGVQQFEPFQEYLGSLGAEFIQEDEGFRITEASYLRLQYPDGWITDQMEEMFHGVISSFNLRKGFNVECNLSHGKGQKTQIVRFPEYEQAMTRYYTTADVSPYHQLLAGAFAYGQERERLQSSRFVSNLTNCLINGQVDTQSILHEIMWYEKPE